MPRTAILLYIVIIHIVPHTSGIQVGPRNGVLNPEQRNLGLTKQQLTMPMSMNKPRSAGTIRDWTPCILNMNGTKRFEIIPKACLGEATSETPSGVVCRAD